MEKLNFPTKMDDKMQSEVLYFQWFVTEFLMEKLNIPTKTDSTIWFEILVIPTAAWK